MQGGSCFFIGHREAPKDIAANLASEVRRHIIELGVTEFIVGHYGRFDSMAEQTVIAAKREFPCIRFLLLIPYHPAEVPVDLPEGYDGTYSPRHGERAPPVCHRPSQPIHGGPYRLPDRIRMASGQQRTGAGRVCRRPAKAWADSCQTERKYNRLREIIWVIEVYVEVISFVCIKNRKSTHCL